MSDKRNLQALRKLIDHTLEYCDGQDFDSFMENRMLQKACVFNVLQIGELAKNGVDAEFAKAHQEIPWRQMYGLRNRIVHDYEGIRMKIVWETITNDFRPLRNALLKILDSLA